MCKPEDWYNQPHQLLERWLWDIDLDYDGWESSKAEEIHSILNNKPHDDSVNGRILNSCWKQVDEERYRQKLVNLITELQRNVEELQLLLK